MLPIKVSPPIISSTGQHAGLFYVGTCVHMNLCTLWSISHATYIKIYINNCKSQQFDWINKHNIAVTIREFTHVASCCNLLAPGCQFSFNSRNSTLIFSQVQRIIIVKHYLISRPYLTCQNQFRNTFIESPVSKYRLCLAW